MFENLYATRIYLLIDDFGEMRSMIKGLLRTLGATKIDTARNAKEALELIEHNRYDVILCDYNLGPGRSGQQLLEEIRHRDLIDMSTVFVMITAENTRDMVMAVVEYEPDSYLSKPFSKDLLGTRLTKLFQLKADLSPVLEAARRHDYNGALEMLEQRIARNPKNLAHLIKLKAEISLKAGKNDQAGEIYQRLLAERDVPWARLGLGKVQFARKEFVEAKDNFDHLVQNQKTMMSAYDWLAKAQRALGLNEDAQSTLHTAVDMSPQVALRQHALGELAMTNQDVEQAEKSYANAVKVGKHSIYNTPKLHAGLAKSKSAAGKHDEALAVINNMGKTFDDPSAAFYAASAEAVVRQDQGDSAAAQGCLEKAAGLHESLGENAPQESALELARAAAHVGNKELAESLLRSAIQNNHDNEEFMLDATDVFRSGGISDDANASVHAIRQEVVEMNNQGVKLISKGKFSEAIELFAKAADSMTSNLVINLNAARALIMQMEKDGAENAALDEAQKFIERSKNLSPNDQRVNGVMRRLQKLKEAS